MKKRNIFQISFVLLVLIITVARGNANALDPTAIYLPVTFRNYCPSLFDDFSNPSSGWYIGENEFAKWEYLNGEYRILTKDDSFKIYGAIPPTCDRENYTVEVDARWVGEPGYSYGITFGIIGDFDQYYIWDINTDYQEYGLWRFDGSEYHTIVPFSYDPYHINSGNSTNHLKVTRAGKLITLEANGNQLTSIKDDSITGATSTIIHSSPYEGYPTSDARFDNFSISSINIPTTGLVDIEQISMCGTGSGEPDEYVEIVNFNIYDILPIQLKGWTLEDEQHNVFTFPSFMIYPGQTCRIYTNEIHPEWCGFSFGSDSEIWNIPGDHAYLRDANGNLIDDQVYDFADPPYCP